MARPLLDESIEGWFYPEEAELLDRLGGEPWCEIGCYRGRSTYILAMKGIGYAVDHWRGSALQTEGDMTGVFDDFVTNVGYKPNVIICLGDFELMAQKVPDGLKILHIDHDHDYEPTKKAFELYGPKVEIGGHVVFHDAVWIDSGENKWPGVTQFVVELKDDPDWKHVEDAGRCSAFQRVS